MSKSIQSVFYCLFLFAVLIGCKTKEQKTEALSERLVLADTIEHLLRTNLVDIWYPACIDTGFEEDILLPLTKTSVQGPINRK